MGRKGKQLHTMAPQVKNLLNSNFPGFTEIFQQLKQLDEASILVEEGKLKQEVYDALEANVQKRIEEIGNKKAVKENKQHSNVFAEVFKAFRSNKSEDNGAMKDDLFQNDKPLLASNMFVRGKKRVGGFAWKKRHVVLYHRALCLYKSQGDTKPKDIIVLTPEYFVTNSREGQDKNNVMPAADDDAETDSVITDPNDKAFKNQQEFVFLLSDLESRHHFACETEAERTLWLHTLTATIRKILDEEEYYDTPVFLDGPVRNPAEIQADYEKRKEAYQKSQRKKTLARTKRRSFFQRGKKMTEEDWKREEAAWAAEGDEVAKVEMAKKLLEHEREMVKRLEEHQEQREKELESARKAAEKWKELAETNKQKAQEAEQIANQAIENEKKLEHQLALLEQRRAQNLEKEEALRAEHETTAEQLNEMQLKRKKSTHPGAMEEYEKEIAALKTKLKALQSALDVDFDGLDWDGTLEDAEAKMKACIPRLMSDNPKESQDAQEEFDKWDKIVRNHADYLKRETDKWVHWEEENQPKNEQALADMRKIVPKEVLTGVSEQFLKKKGLSPAAAKRVMGTKILNFLWIPEESIAKTHIADLNSRYVPQGLDIVELRAIYCRLPKEFQNDGNGQKKVWLDNFRQKLYNLTEKEKQGTLTRPEERNHAYRSAADNKKAAAVAGGAGGKKKKKKKKPAVAKKLDTSKLEGLFAGGPGGPPRGGPFGGGGGGKKPAGFPGAGGPPPHILAMMQRGQQEEQKEGDSSLNKSPAGTTKIATPAASTALNSKKADSPRKSLARSVKDTSGGFFASMKNLLGSTTEEPVTPAPPAKAAVTSSASAAASPPAPPVDSNGAKSAETTTTGNRPKSIKKKKKKKKSKHGMTKKEELLAKEVRGMMDANKLQIEVDDFDEKNAPAFDFGANYGSRKATLTRAKKAQFSKGIEEGIEDLAKSIKDLGKADPAEGGIATVTFGRLVEHYKELGAADSLVGFLMRAKKRKRVKYAGDMLLEGIHQSIKVTLLF